MTTAAEMRAAFNTWPLCGVETLLQGRRALLLAPHPDDESLGCGGLIAAATEVGLPPEVVILTDGSASHPGSMSHPPARLKATREAEVQAALATLGLPRGHLYFLRYEDTKLPTQGIGLGEAVTSLRHLAATRNCDLIVAPWKADPHCDHEAAAIIAEALADAAALPLISYPVWGWLLDDDTAVEEPRRNGWRLDIARHLPAKQRAIAAHESQYGDLITDAPQGFKLPAELLEVFAQPYEVFIA